MAKGHELVLWTNRSLNQKAMTQRNLGAVWNMFSEHQFHAGQKANCHVDGIVIDNEVKYAHCGRRFVVVRW